MIKALSLFLFCLLASLNVSAIDIVSLNSDGTGTGDDLSLVPKVSADGRYVAFYSLATNLVPGQVDSNASFDVFLRDVITGSIVLVSHAASDNLTTADANSVVTDISSDGRYVVYSSTATNLISGFIDNGGFSGDVYVYDRLDQSTRLISAAVGTTIQAGSGHSNQGYLSPNDSAVIFASTSNNLVSGFTDNNGAGSSDVYIRFLGSNTTVLVSHSSSSLTSGGSSGAFTVSKGFSGDGSKVVFTSASTNLISGGADTNGQLDCFLYNVSNSEISLVSHVVGSNLSTGNQHSLEPMMSYDGSTVAFTSASTNLVAGFVNNNAAGEDVYKYDIASGVVTLISHSTSSNSSSANGASTAPAINYNGNVIAFSSAATDLVTGISDTNAGLDTFALDSGVMKLVSVSPSGTSAGNFVASGGPVISPSGRKVAFQTLASNLSDLPDSNSVSDYYVRDLVTGTTTLAATNSAGTQASGSGSEYLQLARNGFFFHSYSSDINGTDSNGAIADVFLNALGLVVVSSPATALMLDADTTVISGTAESGSLVRVYLDADADEVKDDTEVVVSEQQLSAGATEFAITVALTKNSSNRFYVTSADVLGVDSFIKNVPAITDISTFVAKILGKKKFITLRVVDETGAVRLLKKPFGKKSGRARILRQDKNADGILDIVVKAKINGKRKQKTYSGVNLSLI